MEFYAVILFLILYFVRFQDWVPMLGGMNLVKPAMALAFIGILSREERRPPWRLMRTPHEWVMVALLGYCIYVDSDPYDTFTTGILPLGVFYFLTAYSLVTERRLTLFLSWWCGCIIFMCVVAVMTDMGVDLTNAQQLILSQKGRLCLNTYLLDNPNSLGHTAISAIPFLYMLMIFRRDVGSQLLSIPMFIVIGLTVVSSESKGAYLSGAGAIAVTFLLGRKPIVQILIAGALIVIAPTVAVMLPRMTDRSQLRSDEGVMGRLRAFELGRTAYETAPAGWNKFSADYVFENTSVSLDAHSSFVRVGADLGPTGLFLYVSALCVALRSLFRYRTDSDELERCRRTLVGGIVAFIISGWMINRAYHTEYFLLIGAATAYHRLAIEHLGGIRVAYGDKPVSARAITPTELQVEQASAPVSLNAKGFLSHTGKKLWNRYGLVDFGVAYVALQSTVWFWSYIIDNL